jgi:hypothetical protein
MRICRILDRPKDFPAAIAMIPQSLSASKPRLLARHLVVKFKFKHAAFSSLMMLPNRKADEHPAFC